MRKIVTILTLLMSSLLNAQTGPGGVGLNDGSSSLKLWYRTDNGVSTTGTLIDQVDNSAGVAALNISETGTQRPNLISGVVNGYDEMSFNGTNRLRTGLNLTTTNFVTNEASTFMVCRADNTAQTSSVYTTDPLVGSTRFSCHIPWSNTVYYDIGTCCGVDARIQVGGLAGLTNYSYWSYDAHPTSGKQLYRNGGLLQNRANTTTYTSHATQRFNIGANTGGTNGFVGDITEVIIFRNKINTAQRIIIENYLSAKYNIPSAANDLYIMDNPANGNYDHDVAGIGRVNASNIHNDSQGTGIVRILNPTGLDDDEFLMWGHDNGVQQAINTIDVPISVEARFDRVWRVSESNAVGSSAVDVGDIDMRWDLNGLGVVTASDLRLLIDDNNNGIFSDDTPIAGAVDLGGGIYEFQNVPGGAGGIQNARRFTLGTINSSQTPLPIELVFFNATPFKDNRKVKLEWQTASEINNDFFTVEKSLNGTDWEIIKKVDGSGNSNELLNYSVYDYEPNIGVSYYRLKQTDFDGQFEYSQIKSVSINQLISGSVEIYPNPTNDKITVIGIENELSEVRIFNPLGQDVTNLTTISSSNESTMLIDVSRLAKGIYYVKTKTTANSVYKK
jgi:hypothetical protein